MQIGDLIKPKLHLELIRRPVGSALHTRWDDPQKDFTIMDFGADVPYPAARIVGQERLHAKRARNRSGIATFVSKIKLLVGGTTVLLGKTELESWFEPV